MELQRMEEEIRTGDMSWQNPENGNFQSCSPEAQDLITRLICFDPDLRFTVDQALDHAWFKANLKSTKPDNDLIRKILTNFLNNQPK